MHDKIVLLRIMQRRGDSPGGKPGLELDVVVAPCGVADMSAEVIELDAWDCRVSEPRRKVKVGVRLVSRAEVG
jgi:hypothetical protein